MDLAKEVQALGLTAEVIDMKGYDPEDSLSEEVSSDWPSRLWFPPFLLH